MRGGSSVLVLILPAISLSILAWSFYQTMEKNRELRRIDRDLSIFKISAYQSKYTFIDEASNALDSILVNKVEESTEKGATVPLLDFLSDEPTLVYRVSDSHCNSCVEATLSVLRERILEMPQMRERIIILANYQTVHSVYAWKIYNEIEFDIYVDQRKSPILKSDEVNKPYLFILLPNSTVTCLFIPSEYKREFTFTYLDIVYNKFFSKK